MTRFLILQSIMLNKLFYFKEHKTLFPAPQIANAFEEHIALTCRHATLVPATEGTLGLTYLCQDTNGITFIKSHLPGAMYRETLKKESFLLQEANPGTLQVKEHVVEVRGEEQLFLEMDVLTAIAEISPQEIRTVIRNFQKNLDKIPVVSKMVTLEDLCCVAQQECRVLSEQGLFGEDTSSRCTEYLEDLLQDLSDLPCCICHGDLGDRNLMKSICGEIVVVDWEDAFWGCPGYDYLYWLTFFNHRKFYSSDVFRVDGLTARQARAIVTLILVIKSAISFYSGTYLNNSLTLEERLLEIWSFWGGLA